jgi:hypothetical protein
MAPKISLENVLMSFSVSLIVVIMPLIAERMLDCWMMSAISVLSMTGMSAAAGSVLTTTAPIRKAAAMEARSVARFITVPPQKVPSGVAGSV